MKTSKEEVLNSLYTDIGAFGSYGGVQKLYRHAKQYDNNITLKDVRKWLERQDTYTLHKQAYKKFKRNRIYVSGIDAQWEADLVDMQTYSAYNSGYKYMICCIDVFSKFAWVKPLRNKSANSICTAFKDIISNKRKPWCIRTDKGKEFINHEFQKLLKFEGIKFFTSQNEDIKCSIVERFNRTLKSKMWRYFTHRQTFKWIDILQQLVSAYNNSIHRSIREKPINVTYENESDIRNHMYPRIISQPPRLQVNDYVRISKFRQPFDKGYLPQWTEETFSIYKVLNRATEPLYKIRDLQGEEIQGTFYGKELQKVIFDNTKTYKIEKILKRKKLVNGSVKLFVKWRGYPDKFNEWINETDLE